MAKCSSCGKEIVWLNTSLGKAMPVDAETVTHGETLFDFIRHTSHFSSCPDADSYRKEISRAIRVVDIPMFITERDWISKATMQFELRRMIEHQTGEHGGRVFDRVIALYKIAVSNKIIEEDTGSNKCRIIEN